MMEAFRTARTKHKVYNIAYAAASALADLNKMLSLHWENVSEIRSYYEQERVGLTPFNEFHKHSTDHASAKMFAVILT